MKKLHVLPSTTFNYFCSQVNVLFTKDGIRTLIDVIIANPMSKFTPPILHNSKICHLQCGSSKKKGSYCNQHPIDQFLPLIIEMFWLFRQIGLCVLHDYANPIWSLKVPEGLHLSILVTFLHQKISITLQKIQASSILNGMITIGLITSHLPPLQDTPPITRVDLL